MIQMHTSLLHHLVKTINTKMKIIREQVQLIQFLLKIIFRSNLLDQLQSKAPSLEEPTELNFQKFQVDELPIIEETEKLDFRILLAEYKAKHGKDLKPVQRRNGKQVPSHIHCPRCDAPHEFLYDNNGGKGQYSCKVCETNFNIKNRFAKELTFRCPHCQHTLSHIKTRKGFKIYKCVQEDCPYYVRRLNELSSEARVLFEQKPYEFKMHYIYREFDLPFTDLTCNLPSPIETVVDLSKIYSSPQVLGLILTYHVNYGLSAEKTAALMYDVHQVKISGQTIRNYARSVGAHMQPFTTYYPYQLSDQLCGDETYIRVLGSWNYIYFFFDAKNKIILSHRYSPNRDTQTAIKAIYDVIRHYGKDIPENLNLVVDGNPIYLLAQQYFQRHGIDFDITQVIGLTNEDPVSKEYRPLKQIVERLNRTFKANYKPLGGFGSESGAIAQVVLFSTFFNFLRSHSALEKGRIPVQLEELNQCQDMPSKWIKLIQLASEFKYELPAR